MGIWGRVKNPHFPFLYFITLCIFNYVGGESIPRNSRENIHSTFLHIIVQGIEKKFIFDDEKYKEKYINLIQENSKKFNIDIISFCIMSNHAHICIHYNYIEDVSKFMHIVNSMYANYYNFVEDRDGYVFKNRYYSKEIKDRNQLFNTIAYIHKNPVKARIVKKIGEWKYSTYNKYINYQISKDIIMLVFETENYIDNFNIIHSKECDIEIFDVKDDLKSSKEIIEEFLQKYNISLNLIKKEKNLLFELIMKMKKEGKVLNKNISKELQLGKNTITRIIKNAKNI